MLALTWDLCTCDFLNYLKKLYDSIGGDWGRPLLYLSTNLKGRKRGSHMAFWEEHSKQYEQ